LEQAKLFKIGKQNLEHVVLSHVDRAKNQLQPKPLLDIGVRVGNTTVPFAAKKNFGTQLYFKTSWNTFFPNIRSDTLGMDIGQKMPIGKVTEVAQALNYLIENYPTFLKSKGLEDHYKNYFFDNPKRLYAFSKKS